MKKNIFVCMLMLLSFGANADLGQLLKSSVRVQNHLERIDHEKTGVLLDSISNSLERINENLSVDEVDHINDLELDECEELNIDELICESIDHFYVENNTCDNSEDSLSSSSTLSK